MNIRLRSGLVVVCAATLSTGCAGIGVSKAPSLNSGIAIEGVPWNLAMTRFTVTITRHITECGPSIKARVETLASASSALDPEQRYLLKSNGWFATSDIKSTVTVSGFNTALNAESADATATVIGNVIGTAAQVAIGFAAAGAGGPAPAAGPAQICKGTLKTAVEKLYPATGPTLKKQVEEATAKLAQETANVALFAAQVTANSDDTDIKTKLVTALSDQDTARIDLKTKSEGYAAALKAATNTQTVTWPTKSSEFRRDTPYSIDSAALDKWIITSVDGPNAKKQMDVYLALYTEPDAGGWSAPAASPDIDLKLGIPVRLPRSAKLLMCTGDKCPDSIADGQALADNQNSADFAVLQAGPTHMIPVGGGAFRSENATISLDANGVPTALQTTQKVAGAAVLSGAAKDAATQLAALPAALRATELAKTKAETDQLNADATLQTAIQTAGVQSQSAIVTNQTALINAQIANSAAKQNAAIQPLQQQAGSLTAQASVFQAQAVLAAANANAQVVDQTSALGAQATLINAETALINAAAALVKAQGPAK